MQDINKTLELLSRPYSGRELMDKLHVETNPSRLLLYIGNGSQYTLRFLGPFMQVKRLYIPDDIKEILINENLYPVIKGDTNASRKIAESLDDILPGHSRRSKIEFKQEIISFLAKVLSGERWSSCVMVNVLVRNNATGSTPSIKVFAINKTLALQICSTASMTNISGIDAQDIIICATGQSQSQSQSQPNRYGGNRSGRQDRLSRGHSVSFNPKSSLNDNELEVIFKHGLIDIPILLDKINQRGTGRMLYRMPNRYKMSDELMKGIMDQAKLKEENLHFEQSEKDIGELPKSAFEKNNKKIGIISGIEV